jgi:glucose/arabinose dehydrogenase
MACTWKSALAGAAALALVAAIMPTPGAAQDSRFTITTLADGLAAPWSVAFLPDGSMLVTEKAGPRLRLVTASGLAPEPISGLPDDIFVSGQGGLLDVAPHPDFAQNRMIYFTYAAGSADANATKVARARLDGSSLSGLEVLFTASPLKQGDGHFGGRLAFLPDGTFVLTVGDGFIQRENAQRLGATVGKTIRLNADGSAPSNNPFVGQEGAAPEIWTLGHRSPQGLAYDAQTGVLYETEHGPWGGDELNRIEPGANYGWPAITHGRDYNGAAISPFTEMEGMEQPLVNWTPVIAASGLAIYRGPLFSDWDGDILAGGLQANGVVRVEIDASGAAREAERLFTELGERVRDVRVGPDGAVYLVTDHPADGKLIRVTPR